MLVGADFSGEYSHTVDAKGRMTMPSKLRNALGEICYLIRGLDGCLAVYSQEGWDEFRHALLETKKTSREARKLQRQLFSKVATLTYDKQGRILIPQEHRIIANIEKEVMVIGVGDRVEIWDRDIWKSYDDMDDDTYADLIEGVMNVDFDMNDEG